MGQDILDTVAYNIKWVLDIQYFNEKLKVIG